MSSSSVVSEQNHSNGQNPPSMDNANSNEPIEKLRSNKNSELFVPNVKWSFCKKISMVYTYQRADNHHKIILLKLKISNVFQRHTRKEWGREIAL